MLVIGAETKNGVFRKDGQEISYNNLYLYCTREIKPTYDENGNCTHWANGSIGETVKIKNTPETLKEVFGTDVNNDLISALIGQNINVYYDQYGKVQFINAVKADKKA